MEGSMDEMLSQSQILSTQENVACVKARLQEEGREARNLIAYSLPLQSRKNSFNSSSSDKPPKAKAKETRKVSSDVRRFKQQKRHRSASAGRDPQASLRARHWGFLFRNLQQAVDEIYQTSEDDESIIECKEAILMLERYANDFYKLIEWLKIKWEYENTSPPQRPNSLTWEIRTSSPGKMLKSERKTFSILEARKALNFDHLPPPKMKALKSKLENDVKSRFSKQEPGASSLLVLESSEEVKSTGNQNGATAAPFSPGKYKDEALKIIGIEPHSSDEILRGKDLSSVYSALDSISESPPSNSVSFMGINSSETAVTPIVNLKSSPDKLCEPDPTSDPSSQNCSLYAVKVKDTKSKAKNPSPSSSNEDKKKSNKEISDGKKNIKEASLTKQDPQTSLNPEEALKNTQTKGTILKEESFKPLEEGDQKKGVENHLPKNLHPKPGPLVNMNKASQVRKAFNQNRTPLGIRNLQGTAWRNPPVLQSGNKNACSKQQGAGGRLTMKRLTEGKPSCSPPLNRRSLDGKGPGQKPMVRGMLERSSTSYPMTRSLLRSSTTLDGSPHSREQLQKLSKRETSFCSEGKCPSNSSLASSTNTSSSGQSWADKVKGCQGERKDSVSQISLQDEEEGWEVVRRNRRCHGGSAASLNSQGNRSASKTTHKCLQKKGSFPFNMQSRFQQPSSAVSMPSLDTEPFIEVNFPELSKNASKSLQKAVPSCRKNMSNSSKKSNASESKKLAEKSKSKMPREDSIKSESSSNRSSNKSSCNNSPRTKDNPSASLLPFISDEGTTNPDKHKKDEANTKTQNEIKSLSSQSSECIRTLNSFPNIEDDSNKLRTTGLAEASIASKLSKVNGDVTGTKQDNEESKPHENTSPQMEGSVNGDYSQIKVKRGNNDDSGDESEREDEEMRCNEKALQYAVEKEKRLKQQIEETERAAIVVADEIDEDDPEEEDVRSIHEEAEETTSTKDPAAVVLKDTFYEYDPSLSTLVSLSWAEQMDAIEKMESVRPPGRVLHIHEKLSSPSRKLPISEKLRRHKEKLAKAQELRGKLITVKTEKLKDLFRKIDEVNVDKERLLMEKKGLFTRKMERAEEKRRCHLQEIVNKAHDEENKAKEIAFINGLEAQNKLHDIMQQHQSHESRLADIAEERNRKQEEKAAKEAAAQERRKAMEAKRQARMLELCEKRRRRCERIDRQQAERREELLEQAREKARDREERLSALQQAQQAKESELVKKIQQKQEETARRHEENIEQIRQKALESSIMKYSRGSDEVPKLRRYETKKLCTLCNSVIPSEVYLLSHIRGRRHQDSLKELHKRDVSQEESETYNLKFIINAPENMDDPQVTLEKERQKAMKKRCKKIRTRMRAKGKEFLEGYITPPAKDSTLKGRTSKSLGQIGKLLSDQGSGPWPQTDVTLLDRHLLELLRVLEKGGKEEQRVFASLDGFRRLFRLLDLILTKNESPCVIPPRSLAFCARVLSMACKDSQENCHFLLFSNLAGNLVDFVSRRLDDMLVDFARNGSNSSINTVATLPSDPAAAALMELFANILQNVHVSNGASESEKTGNPWPRLQDLVTYCVCMGVADNISWYFNHVQNPVENDPPSAEIILSSMSLLSALAFKLSGRSQSNDPTQLISTFHVMEACGVVSLLYGLLLHQGGRSPSPPSASHLSPSTLAISAAAVTLLHNLAELDLNMFQAILGSEGISLEFRHIASFLLWYCSHWPCEEILHNVIALVGFFAVNNKENQSIIQSGETPSVLQQLCSLPWQYFSEPHLTGVLFPTLLACCLNNDDNLNILEQEMSFQVLEDYLVSNQPSKKPLMQLLHRISNSKNSSKCI